MAVTPNVEHYPSLVFLLPVKKEVSSFCRGKVVEVAMLPRQKPLTLTGFLSNTWTILMHKTGLSFPEPGIRAPGTIWIRNQSWVPFLIRCHVSPHKEGMQWIMQLLSLVFKQSSVTAPTEKYNCAVESRSFFTKMKWLLFSPWQVFLAEKLHKSLKSSNLSQEVPTSSGALWLEECNHTPTFGFFKHHLKNRKQ